MKLPYFIVLLFSLMLLPQINKAQISVGPLAGVNLSMTDNFSIDKTMFRHGLYAGIYGKYTLNNWLSFGLEAAWSEKNITYFNETKYSAFGKLQAGLQQIYPEFPDLSQLFQAISGTTGINLNDSVTETRNGMVCFRSVEVPLMAEFRYRKFGFTAGGFGSYLFGAETTEILEQDIPLFDLFPPALFDQISPFLSGFIYSTFPAMRSPVTSVTTSTKNLDTFDYGLIAGFSYHPDDFLTLRLQYLQGLSEKLSPSLPVNRTHSVIRFSVSYNILGKVNQKPLF